MSGRVSHKSEQTRNTDARAKYSFHAQAKRQNLPGTLTRVMGSLTDATTKPVVVRGKENGVKPLLATPTDGTTIGGEVPAGGNVSAPAPTIP